MPYQDEQIVRKSVQKSVRLHVTLRYAMKSTRGLNRYW